VYATSYPAIQLPSTHLHEGQEREQQHTLDTEITLAVLGYRVALPGGEQSVLGEHQSAVRCVQHITSRDLLVTGSWDQVRVHHVEACAAALAQQDHVGSAHADAHGVVCTVEKWCRECNRQSQACLAMSACISLVAQRTLHLPSVHALLLLLQTIKVWDPRAAQPCIKSIPLPGVT
jgi:hypothetical protein